MTASLRASATLARLAPRLAATRIAQAVQMNDAHAIRSQPAPDGRCCIAIADVAGQRREPLRGHVFDHIDAGADMPQEVAALDVRRDVANIAIHAAAFGCTDVQDRRARYGRHGKYRIGSVSGVEARQV